MEAFSPSWVIIERATGRVIHETFKESVARSAEKNGYHVVPIKEHLASLNRVSPTKSEGET